MTDDLEPGGVRADGTPYMQPPADLTEHEKHDRRLFNMQRDACEWNRQFFRQTWAARLFMLSALFIGAAVYSWFGSIGSGCFTTGLLTLFLACYVMPTERKLLPPKPPAPAA